MSIINEREINHQALRKIAEQMLIAARTAPKARGMDNLEVALLEGESIRILADKMKEIGHKTTTPFILRDAANIENVPIIVILGTKIDSIGLQDICGYCGYDNCNEREKHPEKPCAYNANDLGIAIGSAVSVAIDNRVDNRVMFSIGKAALELGLLGKDVKIILGIPLSATGKNPFFDRK